MLVDPQLSKLFSERVVARYCPMNVADEVSDLVEVCNDGRVLQAFLDGLHSMQWIRKIIMSPPLRIVIAIII